MSEPKTKLSSALAALTIATLTLAVFLLSQGRGPQSVVEKFHEALSRDTNIVLEGLYTKPRGPEERLLEDDVRGLTRTSRSVRAGQPRTLGKSSEVDVVYDSLPYGLRSVKFVLQKSPDGWVIDAGETLARTRESSLF